jgi:hypothetical protein
MLEPVPSYIFEASNFLVTGPASEPVTADQLRAHIRETVSGLSDEEALGFITRARIMYEQRTGAAIMSQTWRMAFDDWPHDYDRTWREYYAPIEFMYGRPRWIELRRWPLQSVTSVTTYDASGIGTESDVAATFDLDTTRTPGRIGLKLGATWPSATRPINGVVIDYVAGFGATAGVVPADVSGSVLAMAAYLYSHRGDSCAPADVFGAAGHMGTMRRPLRI